MESSNKVQCDLKRIDVIEMDCGATVEVWLLSKKSVKRYCRDMELEFKEGLKEWYKT